MEISTTRLFISLATPRSKIASQGSFFCCIIQVSDQNSKYLFNKQQNFNTMEGSSTTKPRDQHTHTDQIPHLSTPNENRTPQQTHMMNVTSCSENQTSQQTPVTNGVLCPPWAWNFEIMGQSIIIPKGKRGKRRARNTWSMLDILDATPPSANVTNPTTIRQASDVDASNLMLLAGVCERAQTKGLDELILECKKIKLR